MKLSVSDSKQSEYPKLAQTTKGDVWIKRNPDYEWVNIITGFSVSEIDEKFHFSPGQSVTLTQE